MRLEQVRLKEAFHVQIRCTHHSRKIIAAYQLATLLKTNGFISQVEFDERKIRRIGQTEQLDLLITDIDDPRLQAIRIANEYRRHQPGLAWFALSQGGNTPAMRDARTFMVGGFFFLSPSGLELDKNRGAACFLRKNRISEEKRVIKHAPVSTDAGAHGRFYRMFLSHEISSFT